MLADIVPDAQDEPTQIGICLCNGLNSILAILQQLQAQPKSDCCDRLISAIVGLQNAIIGTIASTVGALPQPVPVDLSGVTAALNQLVAAAQAEPTNTYNLVIYLCKCI